MAYSSSKTSLWGLLGLVASQQRRTLPPTTVLPLRSCSDVACTNVPSSRTQDRLLSHFGRGHPIASAVGEAARSSVGVPRTLPAPQPWAKQLQPLAHGRPPPYFLGDAVSTAERSHLLVEVMNSDGAVRVQLTNAGENARLRGSNEAVVSRLSEAEVAQSLLVSEDSVILGALDNCLRAGHTSVPPTEVRQTQMAPRTRGGWYRVNVEATGEGCVSRPIAATPYLRCAH